MKEPLACNEIAEPAVLFCFFMLEEDSIPRLFRVSAGNSDPVCNFEDFRCFRNNLRRMALFQFFPVAEAPKNPNRVHSRGISRLHIHIGVADIQAFLR